MGYVVIKMEGGVETYQQSGDEWSNDITTSVKSASFENAELSVKRLQGKFPRDGRVILCVGTLSGNDIIERKCFSPRVPATNYYNSAPYDL